MKYIFVIGFVLMIGAQWYVPVSMIVDAERIIDDGTEYKFKTRPVDPSDPFRGKYVLLMFEAETYVTTDTNQLKYPKDTLIYAKVATDTNGFARIERLSDVPPEGDYIEIDNWYSYGDQAFLSFPFKKFYLEESKASEAEQIYWRSRSDSSLVCYAKVKILNGDSKLVDVIVNDSSIVDVVKRINANKPD